MSTGERTLLIHFAFRPFLLPVFDLDMKERQARSNGRPSARCGFLSFRLTGTPDAVVACGLDCIVVATFSNVARQLQSHDSETGNEFHYEISVPKITDNFLEVVASGAVSLLNLHSVVMTTHHIFSS